MRRCELCNVSEEEVPVVEGIYNGKLTDLCEKCALLENVPVLQSSSYSSISEIKSPSRFLEKKESFFLEDELLKLEKKLKLKKSKNQQLLLIDNFHWEIMKNRRRKGFSHRQLAEYIGEDENSLKLLEKKILPENAERIIRKLEQFFQIRLRKLIKSSVVEQVRKEEESLREPSVPKPEKESLEEKEILYPLENKDSNFNEAFDLDIEIKQDTPSINDKQSIKDSTLSSSLDRDIEEIQEVPDLDIKKINPFETTIAQLRELHKKRIEFERKKLQEEKRKEEERKRILRELRKKDLEKINLIKKELEEEKKRMIETIKREKEERLIREREAIDSLLGGMELLN